MRNSEIRKYTREALQGNWVMVIVMSIIYSTVLSTITSVIQVGVNMFNSIFTAILGEESMILLILPSYFIILMAGILAQALIQLGYLKCLIDVAKRKKLNIGDLFSGTKFFGKAFGTIFLSTIYIMLWSMLFFIPGIVKTLSYSQALLILAQNPDKSPKECIDESRKLMNGKKGQLFGLNFSIMGIMFLVILVTGIPIVLAAFTKLLPLVIIFCILSVVAIIIGSVVLTPYLAVAQVVFHLDLINDLNNNMAYNNVQQIGQFNNMQQGNMNQNYGQFNNMQQGNMNQNYGQFNNMQQGNMNQNYGQFNNMQQGNINQNYGQFNNIQQNNNFEDDDDFQ